MSFDEVSQSLSGFDAEEALDVLLWLMPFGRYKGVVLLDLPEPYLVWFSREGFPTGKLGEAMALALEVKANGLEDLLRPLRDGNFPGTRGRSETER